MEEFIGASLMIKTATKTHIGILQEIELEKQRIGVKIKGETQFIPIEEIDGVELLPEEESQILQSQPETKQKEKAAPQEEGKEEKKQKKEVCDYLPLSLYNQLVERSSAVYGPSREEVVYSGARGALHLFVNIFKATNKKFVVYTGSGLFSEIAVSLARLFLLYNIDVTLVPCARSAQLAKEIFYYESNGGVIAERRSSQAYVVVADIEISKEVVEGSEKLVFLGEYQNIEHPSKDVVFFGAATKDPTLFTGSSILCDVGFSPHIYKAFNLKRYSPKLLQKIAK
ncbi:hypothetical protein NECID01_1556 [Nematocida sp. AWRm77]|nr:hypothetical protein NECID01_1556 [Nematocida sp. AWRm77]